MFRRFFDTRALWVYLRLLREDRHAEVTEHETEHGLKYYLVEVSTPNAEVKMSQREAMEKARSLPEWKGGENK